MAGYGEGTYGDGPYGDAVSLVPVPTYRYITADMLTGRPLAELPLKCDSFQQQLSATGQTTATLALGDLPSHVDWHAATQERRTTLNILRDDEVVWGGPITKNRPTNNGRTAEITAETWEGYLARRRIKSTLTYTNVDVFDIVRGIITAIQAVPGGNVRMATVPGLAGWKQTITYNGYSRPKVLDEITKLSQISPYFEFYVLVTRDPGSGVFTPTFVTQLASEFASQPPIVAQFPGNVRTYDYPSDGSNAANAITGIGKGDGATQLMVEVVDTAGELAAGYPVYEDELSLKDEDDLGRLTSHTQAELTSRLVDYVVPLVTLDGDSAPQFGTYPLGITCVFRATSLYHPAGPDGGAGLLITRRVTGWTVKPAAAGQQETVQLALANGIGKIAPAMDRLTYARYLAALEKRVRTLEIAR